MPEKRLSNEQLTRASLAVLRMADTMDLFQQQAELNERVKVFEAVVWFPLLQEQVNGTNVRGMIGTCRNIKIMTWCCAGRCLIQLSRGDATLTLITADDEAPWRRDMAHVAPHMGPMGIQHIDAEFLDALKLLYEVTRYADQIVLSPDANVTIG